MVLVVRVAREQDRRAHEQQQALQQTLGSIENEIRVARLEWCWSGDSDQPVSYLGKVESVDEKAHLQVHDQIEAHVRREAGVARGETFGRNRQTDRLD